MGKPKFSRKKYETPSHPWQEDRIKEENELIKKYGLKNKKEIWKAQTRLRKYRGQARELLAKVGRGDVQSKKESEQLLIHLNMISILPMNSTLDDVLALDTESILSRRLQTLTYLKGLANTPDQARQLISHGHIAVGNRRVTVPGYMVTKQEESEIGYTHDSPLNDVMHPARPRADFPMTRKIPVEIKPKEEKPTDTIKPASEPIKKEQTLEQKTKPSEEIKKDIEKGPQKQEKPNEESEKEEITKPIQEKEEKKQDESQIDKQQNNEQKPEKSDNTSEKIEKTESKTDNEKKSEEKKEGDQ